MEVISIETLTAQFGEEKVKAALKIRYDINKHRPEENWILLPDYTRGMIAIISSQTLSRGQDDVGSILLDRIKKHQSQTI